MSRRSWLLPLLYAAAAITGGLTLPRLESWLLPGLVAGMSASAAIAIYSSIASGMIALTGIVFSLVFVMVQFSATAYSPRLVLWIARTPVIAHAFGVFSATFLYALAAVAWIDRRGTATVPFLSAAVVVVLLLASVAMIIGLVDRVSMLTVTRMLAFTGDRGRAVIDAIYPLPYCTPAPHRAAAEGRWVGTPVCTLSYQGRPVAVQRVDTHALVTLAQTAGGVIEVVPAVGDTLVGSSTLMNVFDTSAQLDERALRRAIVVGADRTFEQDPKYAIRLLVDIAIRALSPAVNDPSTAVQALDQIGDLLIRLSNRSLDTGSCRDGDGVLRLLIPSPSWADLLRLSLDEIQTYGAGSVQVMRRMQALMADLIAAAPEDRREALRSWQERLGRTIARAFEDRDDQLDASVEDRQGLGVPRRRSAA